MTTKIDPKSLADAKATYGRKVKEATERGFFTESEVARKTGSRKTTVVSFPAEFRKTWTEKETLQVALVAAVDTLERAQAGLSKAVEELTAFDGAVSEIATASKPKRTSA